MNKKLFYVSLCIAILVMLINLIAFPYLPNKIPVHWGLNGEVDRYGSKLEQLLMSALPIVLLFVFYYVPSIDPKKESFRKHSKAYSTINLMIIVFLSGINLIALINALGVPIQFSIVVPVFLGILFIGIGNYTSQIRPNYFVGFRTPWALASEHVWRKTHRFGGYVFIIIGLVPFLSIIIGGKAMILFLVVLFIGIASIYLYSYWVFKTNK